MHRITTVARIVSVAAALAAFAVAFPHAAFAQDATTAKPVAAAGTTTGGPVIIVIDPDRIRREAAAGKGVDLEAEKYAKTFDDENRKDEAALQATAQELDKDQRTLTKDQIDEKRHALAIKAEEVRQMEIRRRQAFEKSANAASLKLYQAMLEASRDVASNHNADVVMRSQALLFFNTQLDVTTEVVELMNKRVAKVEFPPPKLEAEGVAGAAAQPGTPDPTKAAKPKDKPLAPAQ